MLHYTMDAIGVTYLPVLLLFFHNIRLHNLPELINLCLIRAFASRNIELHNQFKHRISRLVVVMNFLIEKSVIWYTNLEYI